MAYWTRERKRKWLRVLVLLLLLYVMLRWFEHSQVYFPDKNVAVSGANLGRPWEDVYFNASDGTRLNGWFFPVNTNSPRAHRVVLLLHGNGGNLGHRLDHCAAVLATGVNVFAIDYRGYGRSEGRPGEEETYLDAQAAHLWLTQKSFAATNIIALGESLGGGVASELAQRETIGGLVLQSTFTSLPDIGAEVFPWLPVRLIATIKYDTRAKLPRIKVPVLVMHSRADTMIGFHHAKKIFASANEPKLLWEIQGDHNSTFDAGRAEYIEGLEKFLKLIETKKD